MLIDHKFGTDVIEENLGDKHPWWQTWQIGVPKDRSGYFTITNPSFEKVLALVTTNRLVIQGM